MNIVTQIKHLPVKLKIALCVILSLLIWLLFCLPAQLFNAPTSFVITSSNGSLLNASIAADGQWRFPYNKNVPLKFSNCITTFEDKRFYYHPGIDPIAICRAIVQNIKSKKVVSGGSTITMQVIRLSKKNNKRNVWNKLIESILALRLELTNSKKHILALYAGNAPFGANVVGVDAAAWRYFGKNADELSWGEAASLAVLPNAPSLVHPGKNTKELLRKRNLLLNKLVKNKTIDQTTSDLARLEPLPGNPKPLPQLAPHLLQRFKKDYSVVNQSTNTSTEVKTTINLNLQKQVTNIILQHHQELKSNYINNAAAIVVEIKTGNVLAYVGNIYNTADPTLESDVDVLASVRSPGSTLKPLLYASLLTEGSLLPKQLIPDIPTQIGGYTPQNFDLGYDGAVAANRALARSLNIPAVRMLQQYKYQRFYDVLKQCGFTSLDKPADYYGMSLILGGCEISPYEMAGVYSSMARMYNYVQKNNGKWNSENWFMPIYIDSKERTQKMKKETKSAVEKNKSALVNQYPSANNKQLTTNAPLFSYTALWHTFNAMNEVMRPSEEGLWSLFSSAQRIAWKTGTSFGFRDGWAVGLTPKYCVVVWVGNTTGEGRPNLTGINTAAPIMFDVFRLLPYSQWFNAPTSGFIYLPVCHESGYKAGKDCVNVDTVMVSESGVNAPVCPYHRIIHLDKTGTYRVTEQCEIPSQMQHVSWFILPPTMEYYYKQNHTDYKPLPPFKEGCVSEILRTFDIIYPEENTKIYVPLEVSGEKGKTIFAATSTINAKLFWHLDKEYIATTENFHQVAVNPLPGKHTLTVVNEKGETVTRKFEILQK